MKKSYGPKTVCFPLPAFLVGTYDENGRPNIMTAAWGAILANNPPCLGVSIQPPRWTHAAILKNKAFTVSFPSSKMADVVDYAGLVSGRDVDKFKVCRLTPVKSDLVNAPYVGECPIVAELSLHKTLDLDSHTLFVGKIEDIKADEEIEFKGGFNMAQIDPIVFNFGGDYHQVGASLGKAFSIGKVFK